MHTPHDIQQALEFAFARQFALLDSLSTQQLAPPYHPGINPPLWEGGHTAYFYEFFLLRPWLGQPPLMPGLDPVWDSFDIDHEDRWTPGVVPERTATLAYMRAVREHMLECLATRPLTAGDRYRYRYAIAHQHMHIESMIWARQTLGYPPPPFATLEHDLPAAAPMPGGDVEVPAGRYRIGMHISGPAADQADEDFAFDCEKPGFDLDLPAFRIGRALVSNGEFLRFVEAGGYDDPKWWSWGGRKWRRALAPRDPDPTRPDAPASVTCPIYWRRADDGWQERRFDRWLPLDPEAPVLHVSYWEAEAWCNWAGRRLPTEFEWEVAALARSAGAGRQRYPWGDRMHAQRVDMDAARPRRVPVSAMAAGDSPLGCRQMLGTAWEWTASQFLPYAGFTHDMYPYMSTLQFGYHKTTRGGSWATSSEIIRATYRQAYLPQRRDVFVGFRTCAR
ncbi:MAG TPA: SUMF1/EgtB/PvdO family nonheme iron enzyme [Thiobacillaceae bacterium]|nr:SUMF1/EgtB/PvdO family nonheme iron enzyme [Thiobacillaceae bacterium]HNU65205.1 SUMF1/EgtB/PvdO family nonheme iron enzyme [Thiobacillaceae bacterium]